MDTDSIGRERQKWDDIYSGAPVEEDPFARRFGEELAAAVAELLPEGARILEAGCGAGQQGLELARLGRFDVTLLDFSREALAQARRLFAREGLAATFIEGDAFASGPAEFDLVFNAGVLEHYDPRAQAAMLRAMGSRSRGWVLALVPNRLCAWYWPWRLQASARGRWTFGKEIPVADLRPVLQDADLHPVGRRFMGAAWTEALIAGFSGLSEDARREALAAHRAGLVPEAQRSYLVAGLASVVAPGAVPPGWADEVVGDEDEQALLRASLADALALRLSADAQLSNQRAELERDRAELERVRAELERVRAEREASLASARAEAESTARELKERARIADEALVAEQAQHAEHLAQLERVCASNVWKAGKVYYRLRDEVAPFRALHAVAKKLKRRIGQPAGEASPQCLPARRRMALGGLVGHTLGKRGQVSVILPVYNQASMLDEAIRSVLAQTYKDFELIVVNDGSNDDVEAVLDRYAADPRVVTLTQPNQKLPSALNNGFAFATGEYYSWTSADNLMHPEQLERLVAHLEAHPELVMAYSDYRAIDDRGAPLRNPTFRPHNQDPADPSHIRLPDSVTEANFHESGDNFLGASFVYRRDAAHMVGRYAEDTFGGEDYDYWLRMHAVGGIGHVQEVLYEYRVHDNTLNAKAKELKLFDNIHRLLERDAARRKALRVRPSFTGVGVPCPTSGNGPEVLLYALSRAGEPQVKERLGRKDILSVCCVDMLLSDVDVDAVRLADLVLVRDPQLHRLLQPSRRYDTFLLDPDQDSEILARLAHLRGFDKQHVPQTALPPARPYRCSERLRAALAVDSLDRGGLEQIVGDLAGQLAREHVDLTVLVKGAERGTTGDRLVRDGIDVELLRGDLGVLHEVVRRRRLEVVNLHHSTFGLPVYHREGVGTCYTVHTSYTWFDEAQLAAREVALRDVDFFVAVSAQVQRYFVGKLDVDADRVRVIPNGLDHRQLTNAPPADRAMLGLTPKDHVFIHVGSFNRVKHHNLLLAAMRELVRDAPHARLLLVGNPADVGFHNECLERIARFGLARHVQVLPWQPRERVAGLLRMADTFVLPSVQEGWSIAVMEAMHAGLPLILSDVGSAREVICDGDIGIVIPNPYRRLEDVTPQDLVAYSQQERPHNTDALLGAMRDMISGAEAWKAKARVGPEKIASEFSIGTMAARYADVFREVAHVHAKRSSVGHTARGGAIDRRA